MLSEKSKTPHNLKRLIIYEASLLCKLPQGISMLSLYLFSQLGSVQGRFSMAAWRLLSLQRLAFKIGPSLISGRLTGKPI